MLTLILALNSVFSAEYMSDLLKESRGAMTTMPAELAAQLEAAREAERAGDGGWAALDVYTELAAMDGLTGEQQAYFLVQRARFEVSVWLPDKAVKTLEAVRAIPLEESELPLLADLEIASLMAQQGNGILENFQPTREEKILQFERIFREYPPDDHRIVAAHLVFADELMKDAAANPEQASAADTAMEHLEVARESVQAMIADPELGNEATRSNLDASAMIVEGEAERLTRRKTTLEASRRALEENNQAVAAEEARLARENGIRDALILGAVLFALMGGMAWLLRRRAGSRTAE